MSKLNFGRKKNIFSNFYSKFIFKVLSDVEFHAVSESVPLIFLRWKLSFKTQNQTANKKLLSRIVLSRVVRTLKIPLMEFKYKKFKVLNVAKWDSGKKFSQFYFLLLFL
jgi:hypothetical protein